MILVELFYQGLNQEYDVHMDETLPVGNVIETVVDLIAQKEHLPLAKEPGLFLLCDPQTSRVLHPKTTLSENGIGSGHRLMLL